MLHAADIALERGSASTIPGSADRFVASVVVASQKDDQADSAIDAEGGLR